MLPCQTITVSLGGIDNPNHSPQLLSLPKDDLSVATAEGTRVLHLDQDGEYSFIEVGFLLELYAKAFGSTTPMPHIDNDSRVTLRWHYPSLDTMEETTHRVLRDITYPVILRKNDWIEPITRLWSREQQRLPTTGCPLSEEGDDEMGLRAESETDESSHWDASSPAASESTTDEDWQSNCGFHHAKPRWPESELVDSGGHGDFSKGQSKQHF
jgi:hypothetical protein